MWPLSYLEESKLKTESSSGSYISDGMDWIYLWMRVVLTGYGRFGGVDENPTEMIIRALLDKCANVDHLEVLDVSVDCVSQFHDRVDCCEDTLYVHLGVHGDTKCMLLEKYAYNNMTFRIPDQAGFCPAGQCIDDNAPLDTVLQTEIDIEKVIDRLTAENFTVRISTDPGRFLCNYVYYQSLRHLTCRGHKGLAVFVHVPPVQNMSIDDQIIFVERCIDIMKDIASNK